MPKFERWNSEPVGEDVAYMIRVSTVERKSPYLRNFEWPESGYVEASGIGSRAGLYGLLDGIGSWSRMPRVPNALWQIVAVMRSECEEDVEGGAVFAPRGWVVYSGDAVGALQIIMPIMSRHAGIAGAESDITDIAEVTQDVSFTARETDGDQMAVGPNSALKTNGARSHAISTKGKMAVATGAHGCAFTGADGYAHATGRFGLAIARGMPFYSLPGVAWSGASAEQLGGVAACFSREGRARAGEGGAIVLTEWVDDKDGNPFIKSVFASKVGENGIKPDTYYTLIEGRPIVADDDFDKKQIRKETA